MNTQPNRQPPQVEATQFHLRERYFWQSRSNLRDPPQLVDLHTLAKEIRRAPACPA